MLFGDGAWPARIFAGGPFRFALLVMPWGLSARKAHGMTNGVKWKERTHMRGIRYDPEKRKGCTLFGRTDLFATLARLAAACLAVAFALLLAPEKAYAITYGDVIYGPTVANGPLDNTSYYVQVYAFDRYTAALGALGYNPQDSRFTSDVKAYLSNSSTGGAFYDFAQQFTDSPYENNGGSVIGVTVGVDVENTGMYVAYRQNVNLYGSNVWWANYTTTQSLSARTSVGLILAGEIAGGGTGTTGDTLTFVGGWKYSSSSTGLSTIASTGQKYTASLRDVAYHSDVYSVIGSPFTVTIPKSIVGNFFEKRPPETYQYVLGYYMSSNGGTKLTLYAVTSLDADTTVTGLGDTNGTDFSYLNGTSYLASISYTGSMNLGTFVPNDDTATRYYTATSNTLAASSSASSTFVNSSGTVSASQIQMLMRLQDSVPVPPTNWPTDPTPEPPTDPVVPGPPTYGTPTQPTIPGPTADPVYGNQTIYITNNFTADFQGIIDALDEHCRHLQNALYNNMSDFYTKLTTKMTNDFTTLRTFLHGEFGWLGDSIVDIADDMMDYLHDLFEWLANQFDFSVSGGGYDDNTVVAWLKKIYSKLGGGVNTRPTDPVSDPIGFGDWLNQLLQNFVLDLLAMGQNVLADLVESFRQLITKFPFSIPWDIAAFLALLVAEPVAPNIDWPLYTISGSGLVQVATCEIDLEDYDSIMGGVRAMETLLFACWLAFKIDFFKGVVSGIGGNK